MGVKELFGPPRESQPTSAHDSLDVAPGMDDGHDFERSRLLIDDQRAVDGEKEDRILCQIRAPVPDSGTACKILERLEEFSFDAVRGPKACFVREV